MSDIQYQGRFIWRDLNTSDFEKSTAFFMSLFGWTTEVVPTGDQGTYTIFKIGDSETFGGITQLDAAQGTPSRWLSYVSAEDVDDLCARASDMGATVTFGPVDIPEIGRWAILSDPQGAYFSVMAEAGRRPIVEPADNQPHGSVVWNELMTADVEAARAFYSRIFGWTAEDVDVGTGPYTLLKNSGVMVGGLMKKPDDMPVSVWTIYFQVTDIDQAVQGVEELGGQILSPVMEVPQTGRITWATDPAGATFGIMQPEPMPA